MWLVALLPFRALYALSDGLYFLMRHVVHYRKKVVRRNLRNSFPEKSETELMEIERKFYHYICDYMLEEVKMLRMSFEELCRRMKYDNKEEYLAMIEKHGGIVLLIPHYANFEWIIGMGAIMHPGDIPVQVYKPLSNKYLDEMFKHIRARFGGYNVAKHSTAREVIKLRREGQADSHRPDYRPVAQPQRGPLLDHFLESGHRVHGWRRAHCQADGLPRLLL